MLPPCCAKSSLSRSDRSTLGPSPQSFVIETHQDFSIEIATFLVEDQKKHCTQWKPLSFSSSTLLVVPLSYTISNTLYFPTQHDDNRTPQTLERSFHPSWPASPRPLYPHIHHQLYCPNSRQSSANESPSSPAIPRQATAAGCPSYLGTPNEPRNSANTSRACNSKPTPSQAN